MTVPAIRPVVQEDLPALFAYLDDQLQENGRDGMPLFQPLSRANGRLPPDKAASFAGGLSIALGQPGAFSAFPRPMTKPARFSTGKKDAARGIGWNRGVPWRPLSPRWSSR